MSDVPGRELTVPLVCDLWNNNRVKLAAETERRHQLTEGVAAAIGGLRRTGHRELTLVVLGGLRGLHELDRAIALEGSGATHVKTVDVADETDGVGCHNRLFPFVVDAHIIAQKSSLCNSTSFV